ncbi:flavin reductase [Ascidiimonas sp. W6]|uniref:flavin reductase n=1 Tax=Ascidiimonas meishanensis TaxID=3128903 RepID=UPI0030EEA7E7
MQKTTDFIELDLSRPIWDHFFTIAPLVIIGTKEGVGYDMAPKHLAFPVGFHNYFGFVCTPRHSTYSNIQNNQEFSVSFPKPGQEVLTSLSASPRKKELSKFESTISVLPTVQASVTDTLFLEDSYLRLECSLFKIIDGFDDNSIITGKISAAFVNSNYLRMSDLDEQEQLYKHPLLVYVADGRFAKVSETFNFPFPKDFMK